MSNKSDLLAQVPNGAARVSVTDEMGHQKWRHPTADPSQGGVRDTDVIDTNADGTPLVMLNPPGRRKKGSSGKGSGLPVSSANVQQAIDAKKKAIQRDKLLGQVRRDPDADGVLNHVISGLAEEAASLRFEREEAERRGQETSALSVRRVNALKAVGDTYLKRRETITNRGIDLDSRAFQEVFMLIMETYREAMTECGLRDEQVDVVCARLAKKFNDAWYAEARARVKGS